MRQVKRYPPERSYDFGLGINAMFGLRKKAGDFVTEEEVIKNEISEQYLEPKGTERKDWKGEIPKRMDVVAFVIKAEISGENKEEKTRMINQLRIEFKDYIREKGTARIKVVDVGVIESRSGLVIE